MANLACEVQSLREQVLDSKVACLQARQACQMCNLPTAVDHLEKSISLAPHSKILEALRLRGSRLELMHPKLNLDSINLNLRTLLDEYNATLHHIEVVQEALMSLLDRSQVYYTAGLLQDFYKFEPKRIAFFLEQNLTDL